MARRVPPEDLRAHPQDRVGHRRNSAATRKRGGGKAKAAKPGRRADRPRKGVLGRLFGRSGGGASRSRRRRSVLGFLTYWAAVAAIWGCIAVTGVVAYHFGQLPPIDQLAVPKRPPNIAILGDDGKLLANRGDTGGPAIQISSLPDYVPKAFVAIEDRRFYSHWGVDVVGITRAMWRNVVGGGGSMQGGSTLTQQLAKNLFLTQERTLSRKIQEAILAIWLERTYSKDQILELYLNRVYFGSGAYGVEAASQKYFGHSVRQATLQEAAVLAGLMVAPSRLAPNRNPRGASDRAALVISAMARESFISDKMASIALARPAVAVRDPGAGSLNYAADYVMDVLDETLGAIDQDIIVSTTIDPALQSFAEKALAEELDKNGARYRVGQGAVVAMTPGGQIRALVGGRDYSDSQFNRAVAAKRQPGSSFKPFVYLAALERGLTPDSVREDQPINIRGWRPENASREYQGAVTLRRALAMSLNTVSVRLALEVGPKTVADVAHRLGVASDLNPNASIALGTSEVSPLELVGAYAAFANGGIRIQPHVITQVKTASGKLLYRRKGSSFGRVVDPRHVAMMNSMLEETLLTGTARRAVVPGWRAAGKTGTSQDNRDGWFVGYTSQLVAGVWLGNDDSSPGKRLSGGNLPAEIWSRFMRQAHQGQPVQDLPVDGWRRDEPSAPVVSALEPGRSGSGVRPLAPPTDIPGAPLSLNGARSVSQAQPPRRPPDGALLPPANIGASRGEPDSRGLLSRLFGG